MHPVPSFPIFMFCSTGTRLVVMSVQEKLICVRLVMPQCTISVQPPLFYNSQHKCHLLIVSHTSTEHIRYCAVGSMLKRCVSMQLFCRTGQTRGNGVVGEWLDKAVGHLGSVWGPLLPPRKLCFPPCPFAGWLVCQQNYTENYETDFHETWSLGYHVLYWIRLDWITRDCWVMLYWAPF